MNCKPGDLARIVHPAYFGYLVEVLRPCNPSDVEKWEPSAWWCRVLGSPIKTKSRLGGHYFAKERGIRDNDLRPIRDPGEDATDETIAIAGKPQKEPA